MKPIATFAVPFALLLAGCEEGADTSTAQQGGKVEGNVLGGTISDEMLPLEELRSQSPAAKRAAETDQASAGAGASEAPAAEPAPAEEPAPSEAPAEETGE